MTDRNCGNEKGNNDWDRGKKKRGGNDRQREQRDNDRQRYNDRYKWKGIYKGEEIMTDRDKKKRDNDR